jgi:glycosyltransferase involved in cell wall biosynthesis
MKIAIACPRGAVAHTGNRITARRYAQLLRALGHRIVRRHGGADLLIALHAVKSARAVLAFRRAHSRRRIVLVLTGTDLHPRLARSQLARRALHAADALVVLEPGALRRLPVSLRRKGHCVRQSVGGALPRHAPLAGRIVQVGHLRRAKDPLRVALAIRGLEGVELRHFGAELERGWASRARAEMRRNPAYHWIGAVSPARARAELSRAALFVLPSRVEGSSAALIEALRMGVPVLASDAAGNRGTLGARHPGLFAVGATRILRAKLRRTLSDPRRLRRLTAASRRLARHHRPAEERAAWKRLLASLGHENKEPPRPPWPRGGSSARAPSRRATGCS